MQTRRVNRALVMVGVLALAVLLVGTGTLGAPTTIRLLQYAGGNKLETVWQPLIDRFEELNPDIKVEYTPSDLDGFLLMMASGSAPDVSILTGWEPRSVGFENLVDLRPFILRDGVDLQDFPPMTSATFGRDEALYAIPHIVSTNILLYNQDLFEKYGVERPPATWDDPHWTWDEFLSRAKRLTHDATGDGQPDVFGTSTVNFVSLWYIIPMMFGGNWYEASWDSSPDATVSMGLDASEARKGFQFLADLSLVHQVAGGALRAGNAATDIIGTFALSSLGSSGVNWDVAPLPWAGGAVPLDAPRGPLFFDVLTITSREHVEESWRLIHFLLTDEVAYSYLTLDILAMLPARRSKLAWFIDALGERIGHPAALYDTLVGATLYAEPPYWFPSQQSRIRQVTTDEILQPLFRGEASADTLIDQVSPILEAILAE